MNPIVRYMGAAALAALGGVGLWSTQRESARAPEPATLTANLASTTGSLAPAYYTISLQPTTVLYRSGAAATCGAAYDGQPCSTSALATGSTTKQTIVQIGNICTCR